MHVGSTCSKFCPTLFARSVILHVVCDKHVGQKYEQNDSKYKLEHSRVEQGQFKMTTTEKTTHDYQWQHLLVQES